MSTLIGRVAAIAFIAALAAAPAVASENDRPPAKPAAAKDGDKSHDHGSAADTHQESQQNKMKTCNAEAAKKQLKGEERKAFMSSCLRSHH